VKLELNVEPLYFNLHEAIPCGLILNELVSNSLKHAFRDGRQGVIRISLSKADSGSVELTVADNGIGLPGDFRIDTGKSFGMQILDALRNQLRAECFWTGEGGTTFRLVWKSRSPGQQATVTPDEATPATAPAAISR
jgi:two-component sensor histidine kinase